MAAVVVRSCLALKLLALLVVPCSAAEMDLASASRLPTTSPSISTYANESVLVLNRTTRSLPRTGDPIWSLLLETPDQPVRGSDRVVQFSTKTGSLAEVEMDGDVVRSLEAEARSISAAEQGTTNSTSSFNARQDRTTTAARQTGRNPMGGFYSLRK